MLGRSCLVWGNQPKPTDCGHPLKIPEKYNHRSKRSFLPVVIGFLLAMRVPTLLQRQGMPTLKNAANDDDPWDRAEQT
jgi:hypothetical protein